MMTDLGIVAIVAARLSCDHNNTLYCPVESRLCKQRKESKQNKGLDRFREVVKIGRPAFAQLPT